MTTVSHSRKSSADQGRIAALDQFRGALIFLMIAANFLLVYRAIPDWFKHSHIRGVITVIDLGAPLFIFAVGVAAGLALPHSRQRFGTAATVRRYLRRGLILIIFGLLGSYLLHHPFWRDWEILQTIGLATWVALPLFFTRPVWQLVAALALVVGYQLIGHLGYWAWLQAFDVGGLGGVLGVLPWAAVMLIGSTLSQATRPSAGQLHVRLLQAGFVSLGLGLAWSLFLLPDKPLVTGSYVFLTTGLGGLLLWVFTWFHRHGIESWWLTLFGMNPLIVFILSALCSLALQAAVPDTSGLLPILASLVVIYAVCVIIARFLYRQNIFLRL